MASKNILLSRRRRALKNTQTTSRTASWRNCCRPRHLERLLKNEITKFICITKPYVDRRMVRGTVIRALSSWGRQECAEIGRWLNILVKVLSELHWFPGHSKSATRLQYIWMLPPRTRSSSPGFPPTPDLKGLTAGARRERPEVSQKLQGEGGIIAFESKFNIDHLYVMYSLSYILSILQPR